MRIWMEKIRIREWDGKKFKFGIRDKHPGSAALVACKKYVFGKVISMLTAVLWNRNRRNRNFLTSGTGTGTVSGKK